MLQHDKCRTDYQIFVVEGIIYETTRGAFIIVQICKGSISVVFRVLPNRDFLSLTLLRCN